MDLNEELDFDTVEALGLDGTGRDGNERWPYTYGNLTDEERARLNALGDVCEKCGERGSDADPVAHFKHPERFGEYVMAHGQCGEDFELELA